MRADPHPLQLAGPTLTSMAVPEPSGALGGQLMELQWEIYSVIKPLIK